MEIKVLPATFEHLQGIALVVNSLYPESSTSAEEIADGDRRRDPRHKVQRWIACEQGQVVGAGSYSQSIWFDHPQKFMLWIGVLPAYQQHGIGSTLYDAVIDGLKPYDPIALRSSATAEQIKSRHFLEKRGFQEVIRDVCFELNLKSYDVSRYAGVEDRMHTDGIEIKTLNELADDHERDGRLYELDWELSQSVPGNLTNSIGRRGLEQYVEYAIRGPYALPDGFFVAVKGDEYIGLSHVQTLEEGVSLYQAFTGVKPQYRHMGIGLALKLRIIAFALQSGYTMIRTENDADNLPMMALNESLGYERKSEKITFQKELGVRGDKP